MNIQDRLVNIFHLRDIRGGLGRRKESLSMLEDLLQDPASRGVTLDVLYLLPKYGCWQDLFKLWFVAKERVIEIVKRQFLADEQVLNNLSTAKLSLLAKWIPREGQLGAIDLACALVPGVMFMNRRMKIYRQRVSALNRALNTVEIKMCANQWETIVPSEVPLAASKKYKKAFLNESLRGNYIRHINDICRLECRDRFINGISKPKYPDTYCCSMCRYNEVRDRVRSYYNNSHP
jgi:hypothetical protein